MRDEPVCSSHYKSKQKRMYVMSKMNEARALPNVILKGKGKDLGRGGGAEWDGVESKRIVVRVMVMEDKEVRDDGEQQSNGCDMPQRAINMVKEHETRLARLPRT